MNFPARHFVRLLSCALALAGLFAGSSAFAGAKVKFGGAALADGCPPGTAVSVAYSRVCLAGSVPNDAFPIPPYCSPAIPFTAPPATGVCNPCGWGNVQAGCNAAGSEWARGFSTGCIKLGSGGDVGVEALSDSTYARDSVRVLVGRPGGAGNLTLTYQGINLEINPGTLRPGPTGNVVKVLVYADAAAANADPNSTGAGALAFGIVDLHQGPGNPITTSGTLFAPADFTVISGPNGNLNANYTGAASDLVPVTNGPNAVVVLLAEPAAASGGTLPGSTPISLALLAMLLIGGALVIMRGRRVQLT